MKLNENKKKSIRINACHYYDQKLKIKRGTK
jgi:hypothetical protein